MILTPPEIKLRLKALGIRPDKYLGQHFLVDQWVLTRIEREARQFITPDSLIVEAGPGLGVLTERLLALETNKVIAVEKDPIFAHALPKALGHPKNLNVIQGDILDEMDINQEIKTGTWYFIANIPYAITSPLIRKLLYHPNPPQAILVLVQKESAARITAQAGDRNRGLLTVQVEVMAEARMIQVVPPEAFAPPPQVESALLLISPHKNPLISVTEHKDFFRVVIAGFSAKRKQLQNSLSGGLGIDPQTARQTLNEAKIDPMRRAETLTIDEWRRLTAVVTQLG